MERVADCQMFPLALYCVFDTPCEGRSAGGGGLKSEDGWR